MRITGGRAKGIILKVNKRSNLRPTTDFMRESLFSSIGSLVQNTIFLDLFAGTGSYGLEALSRGAQGGIFIEKDRASSKIIAQNLQAVSKSMKTSFNTCKIYTVDVFKTRIPEKQAYNIIFVDPPYELYESCADPLRTLLPYSCLKPEPTSRVVWETPGNRADFVLEGLKLMKGLGKKNKGPYVLIYAPN